MFDWLNNKWNGIAGYTFLVWMNGLYLGLMVFAYARGELWSFAIDMFIYIALAVTWWHHPHRSGQ